MVIDGSLEDGKFILSPLDNLSLCKEINQAGFISLSRQLDIL